MSSRQRKRPGGAVGSRPARKRSRLLASSAGGTLQTEPRDLEESGAPVFEPDTRNLTGEDTRNLTGEEVIDFRGEDVIDLTGESSEPEVITISDDESPVDREQSQQQPHLSRASENFVEPLARNDEEEPIEDDDDGLRFNLERPCWSDEDSEAREQDQQLSHLARSAENSAGPVATQDKEEPRDNDGARPAGPASPAVREADNSQVQDREQSQQYPLGSREAESSAELRASDNEEEPRDNNDEALRSLVSPPNWEDDNAELPEVHEQESRNVTLNSQEDQVDGSGNGTGANDAPVAGSAPAEQGAEEEDTGRSDSVLSRAQQGVLVLCPICLDSYSEIMQHGRQLMATLCGHVFCSGCLPGALRTSHRCPTCTLELYPGEYIKIFL